MNDIRPSLLVLGTGGTIAGKAPQGSQGTYTSGCVDIRTLIESAGIPAGGRNILSENLASVGSQDMSETIWLRLHERISQAINAKEAAAAIVTHGTDTLEETAFLLDLTLNFDAPIVLVGAMRPADAPGADGPRVLVNAFRVATAPASYGRGIIVVSGDTIMGPRCVYKAYTSGTEGMRTWPGGPEGVVSPGRLEYFSPRVSRPLRGTFRMPFPGQWARVPVIYVTAAMDRESVLAVINSRPDGIVLAGVGHGNGPAWLLDVLRDSAASGIPVVRSSRLAEGTVTRDLEVNDTCNGFIAGRHFNPQRCRILLQLVLHSGVSDAAGIQKVFDAF